LSISTISVRLAPKRTSMIALYTIENRRKRGGSGSQRGAGLPCFWQEANVSNASLAASHMPAVWMTTPGKMLIFDPSTISGAQILPAPRALRLVRRKKSPYNPTHSTHPTPDDDSQGLAEYGLASGAPGASGGSGVFYARALPPFSPQTTNGCL
jgi:hypothetical protein